MKLKICIFLFFCADILSIHAQSWTQLSTTGAITARANASAVYVPSQNKMFVFGGLGANGHMNDLWCLDLDNNAWTLVNPKVGSAPKPRYTQVCMFDSLKNRILLFSGQGAELYNDVWAFNLTDNTWLELSPDGNVTGAPLKRYGTTTVFDPLKRRIVSFAGFTTSGRFEDTWAFNLDSTSWTEKSNSSFPLRRCLSSASYAADRSEMIVFGGQSTGNLNDIWVLNLNTFNWTDHTPPIKPIARHFTSNVYCGKGKIVAFGGNSLNQGNKAGGLNDLWLFSMNTNKWDSLPQTADRPLARFGHTAVYIPSKDKMIIFGGQGASSLLADTWVYSGISDVLNSVKKVSNTPFYLTCFPNPSDSKTTIRFLLSENAMVNIKITDMQGRMIEEISNQNRSAGEHLIDLNLLSNGMYICSILTDKYSETIKIIVEKKFDY